MPKKVDSNQAEIVKNLRDCGAVWIPTSGDSSIGFDGIVVFRGKVHLVEIKNGALRLSARRLTDTERKRKEQVELTGVRYWIIQDVDDALEMIGVVR